jgi:hypothetical protein
MNCKVKKETAAAPPRHHPPTAPAVDIDRR